MLLKAGQPSDGIYFILAGEMHVTRGDNKLIGKVTAGRSVGDPELNLVYTDSDQLVVAKDTHCFFLPRENYENLLAIRANAILNQRIDVLNSNFSVFQFWDNARLRSLAHIIKERRLLPNEVLFKDGFKNEYFYFLISGSVTVLKEIDFKEQNVWPTQAKSW